MTVNVHNLNHLVEDVERFGVLYSTSAYPFESTLFTIKKMVKSGTKPLFQIAYRLTERLHIGQYNYKSDIENSNVFICKKNKAISVVF